MCLTAKAIPGLVSPGRVYKEPIPLLLLPSQFDKRFGISYFSHPFKPGCSLERCPVNLVQSSPPESAPCSHISFHLSACISFLVLLATAGSGFAQAVLTSQNTNAPLTITLQDALHRARQNDPQYRSAVTDLGLAREDRVQARAGLLPNLNYNNSFIYTQGTGPLPANCASTTVGCPASKFIANNGVHEYISQADVHQALSLTNFADYRRSAAALAQARAKAEIASRGLVVTVTQSY